MDRGEPAENGDIITTPALKRLIAKEQQAALEEGVAFFNTFEAMGGEGTMARWYEAQPRIVGSDLIHPLPAGGKIVGGLLFQALQTGFQRYKLRRLEEGPVGGPSKVQEASAETGAVTKDEAK
jgi:hypothetical protein